MCFGDPARLDWLRLRKTFILNVDPYLRLRQATEMGIASLPRDVSKAGCKQRTMAVQVFQVRAHFDPDAMVWWAESDDVPGLVAEAKTADDLREELGQLVPELLTMNNKIPDGRPIQMRLLIDEIEDLLIS